jgi:hypothetical protein
MLVPEDPVDEKASAPLNIDSIIYIEIEMTKLSLIYVSYAE